MNTNHIPPEHRLPPHIEKMVAKGKPVYTQTREQVWNRLQNQMSSQTTPGRSIHIYRILYAAAATVILLIASAFFLYNHTTSVSIAEGQRSELTLPDQSQVWLNAGSRISYYPYRWWIHRQVLFEGEAFFKVTKGSSFTVISTNGQTEVLGTAFNINSRQQHYAVWCREGKVKVQNKTGYTILEPMQAATSQKGEAFVRTDSVSAYRATAWMYNRFYFSAVPMKDVVSEIGLQYGCTIRCSNMQTEKMKYSGYIRKTQTPDSVLNYICTAMGLHFIQPSSSAYVIQQ